MNHVSYIISIARVKLIIRKQFQISLKNYWISLAKNFYLRFKSLMNTHSFSKLSLLQKYLDFLFAARIDHEDFAIYHERWNHQDALLICSCEHIKTLKHFFFCWKRRKLEWICISSLFLYSEFKEIFAWLLDIESEIKIFAKWCFETIFFIKIQHWY